MAGEQHHLNKSTQAVGGVVQVRLLRGLWDWRIGCLQEMRAQGKAHSKQSVWATPPSLDFIVHVMRSHWIVVVVQPLSHVRLFVTPRTAAHQAPLTSTISQSWIEMSKQNKTQVNENQTSGLQFLPVQHTGSTLALCSCTKILWNKDFNCNKYKEIMMHLLSSYSVSGRHCAKPA